MASHNPSDGRIGQPQTRRYASPALKNAIRTTAHRLWLASLVHIDPDVAYFEYSNSLTPEQKQLMQGLTEICNFKACSDLPAGWTDIERKAVRDWLENDCTVQRSGRYTFEIEGRQVDFSPAMPLPPIPSGLDWLVYHILSFIANQLWALKLWHRVLRYQATKG